MSNWIKQIEWIQSKIVVDLGFIRKSVRIKQKSLIRDGNILYNITKNLGTYDWNEDEDEDEDEDECPYDFFSEEEKIEIKKNKENRNNFDIKFDELFNYVDLLEFKQTPIDDYPEVMEKLKFEIFDSSANLWFSIIKGSNTDKKWTEEEIGDEIFELHNEIRLDESESTYKYIVVLQDKKTSNDIKIEINLKNDDNLDDWESINLGNMRVTLPAGEVRELNLLNWIYEDEKRNTPQKVKFKKLLDELPKLCDWLVCSVFD